MRYPFNVYQTTVENHTFWIAECPALKGCVGQGETIDEAIKELEINEAEWLATAEEVGIPIPDIPIEQINTYSGKFTLRVAPYVHQKAAEIAKAQGVSLNQYVNDAIVAHNTALSTVDYVIPQVADAIKQIKWIASNSTSKSTRNSQMYTPTTNTQNPYRMFTGD